jgi:hypothetical protein
MAIKKSDKPEPDKKTKEAGLSIEMQTELLNKMEAMTAKMEELEKKGPSNSPGGNQELIEALKTLKNNNGNDDRHSYDNVDALGYLDPNKIDPKDVLEGKDIVRFYAYKSNYVIVDDLRQGRAVQTPFKNKIMFDHMGTKTTGVGKHKETEHSCVYSCKSSKEAEWLKGHSLYNVTFYASGGAGALMSVTSKKASKMASLMSGLKTQDRYSIISMCQQHGIEMMEDANEMRIALANKLSEEIDLQEAKIDEEMVKEMLLTKKEFELND